MNTNAFRKMSYGLFLLTAKDGDKENGCIINTAIQCASEPRLISICAIKKNLTNEMISKTGVFNITVLPESVGYETYRVFGMTSGRNEDKFSHFPDAPVAENGLRYLKEGNALFQCRVTDSKDLGSHVMYVAEITGADVLSDEASATYAYYQSTVKNQAPKPEKSGWRCKICGYVHEDDNLPEDFVCPLCKHGAEDFEKVSGTAEIKNEKNNINEKGDLVMKKFVCKVCGYVHTGDSAPSECPVCHVGAQMFEEVKGEMKLAAEHDYGVYAKTVKNNPDISAEDKAYIYEQLKANFDGECSEVGMYLCMARIAHREGYPEIGLYWEKAAYEEAEHAAKFAELLGEDLEPNMKATTKDNLAWRVDCEFGATAGKVDLAVCAKKNGLDAIHDTVHEMARDEARHGKALKGLLERYFK